MFGSAPPPLPPVNSVVIPDDLVTRLVTDEVPLQQAVETVLRDHVSTLDHPQPTAEQIPFWLERETFAPGDLEDQLRDKVTQRRATEEHS